MNKVLTNINQGLSALEKQTARENIGAENASNRVTTIDENSTDTQYPSAKCVFGALQNVGGGGYKDGGQLVDGDFIKVENNTISSYDNVSRDPVNFYFEVKDGEVLNSVIELTTAVNATINVYVVRNGLYYLLGNVGGNTVNAGEQYNLNVVGDSYALDQVTTPSNDPKFVTIMGQIYGLAKIGTRLWTTENFKYRFEDCYYLESDGSNYQETDCIITKQYDCVETRNEIYYRTEAFSKIINLVSPYGFRIPNRNDINSLTGFTIDELTSIEEGGTNQTGFNAKFKGLCEIYWGSIPMMLVYMKNINLDSSGVPGWAFGSTYNRYLFVGNRPLGNNNLPSFSHQAANNPLDSDYVSIRLCMDV